MKDYQKTTQMDEKENGVKGQYKKGRKNSKSKSYSSSKKSKDDSRSKAKSTLGNDISWYVSSEEMLRDVASFPFSDKLGVTLDFDGYIRSEGKLPKIKIPGVAAYRVYPSVGLANGRPTDPINIAQRAVYSFVRHQNSGSRNYDSPDLMKYLLAMDSLYMWWAYLVRLYGTARVYSARNAYLPQTVLKAMGVADPYALQSSLAMLKTEIDLLAAQMSAFAVPTSMPYFDRHLFLFSKIFKDTDSEKAQVSFMVPAGLYYMDDKSLNLYLTDFGTGDIITGSTPEEVMATIRQITSQLLEPLMSSEDAGTISGDILKAYGSSNLYAFAPLPEGYVVLPEFNPIMNEQFANATVTGVVPVQLSYDANNNLVEHVDFTSDVGTAQAVLNFQFDDVQPADVMYATRLMGLSNSENNATAGSEILFAVVVYNSAQDPNDKSVFMTAGIKIVNSELTTSSNNLLQYLRAFSSFENFPQMYVMKGTGTGTIWDDFVPMVRLCNYRLINMDELHRLNQAAFMGLFGLPYSATQV